MKDLIAFLKKADEEYPVASHKHHAIYFDAEEQKLAIQLHINGDMRIFYLDEGDIEDPDFCFNEIKKLLKKD